MKKDLLFVFLLTFAGPIIISYAFAPISTKLVILVMIVYGPLLWYLFYGKISKGENIKTFIRNMALVGIVLSIIGLVLILELTRSIIFTIPFIVVLLFTGYTYFKIENNI